MRRIYLLLFLLFTAFITHGQTYSVTSCSGTNINYSNTLYPGANYTWSAAVITGTITGNSTNAVGNTTVNETLVNTSATSATAAYSVTESFSMTTFTLIVTVNPQPTVNAISDQLLCKGTLTNLVSFTGTLSGTQFNWTNSNNLIGIPISGTGNINAFTAANGSNVEISGLITVTPVSNTCSGTATNFSIIVKAAPSVNFISSQNICNNLSSSPVVFTGSAMANTVYQWTNSNAAVGLVPLSGTGNISAFSVVNGTNLPITTFIVVTPFSNTCSGTPRTFSITVNPTPSVNSVTDEVLCKLIGTTPVTFTGSPVSNTQYQWTNSNSGIGLAVSGIGNISSFTAANGSNSPITGIITVTPFSNSCSGTAISYSITVKAAPSVNFIPSQNLCNNLTTAPVVFSGSAMSNTVYQWTNSNAAVGLVPLSGTGNISAFSVVNGSNFPITSFIVVTPFSNTCFGAPQTFSITVNPSPSVNGVSDQIVCSTLASNTVIFSGSPVANTSYQWTNSNTGIGLIAASSGTINAFTTTNVSNLPIYATIIVTPYSNSCAGTSISFSYTVLATPTVNALSDQFICNGLSTTPIIFTGSTMANTVYQWTNTSSAIGLVPLSGTGNIAAFSVTNATNVPISTYITVTPFSNTCSGTAKTFSITVNPIPAINPVADQTLCSLLSTSPISFSGSLVPNTNYQWTNTNAAIGLPVSGSGNILAFSATNPSNLAISGLITVTPFSNSCTGTSTTFSITVNAAPAVNGIADQFICNNFSITPVVFSGSLMANTIYQWTNSNASLGLVPLSGTGNINAFTVTNGGNLPISTYITVTPFSNSCYGTAQTFSITANPTPFVNSVSDQSLCALLTTTPVIFSGSSVPNTIYKWTNTISAIGLIPLSGTGNINTFTATNISNVPITSFLSVTPISNTCSGIARNFSITVIPIPAVNAMPDQAICNGIATTQVTFSGSAINNTVYNWTNSTSATGLIPLSGTATVGSFTGVNASNVPVTSFITVTPFSNSCSGIPTSFSITVNPIPTINGIADQVLCALLPTNSVSFSGSIISNTLYKWTNTSSGTGLIPLSGTGNIASFTATNASNVPITSFIQVTPVSNTCSGSSQTFSITVNPVPFVNTISDQKLCTNNTTTPVIFSGSALINTKYNWVNTNSDVGLVPLSGTGDIAAFSATNVSNVPITTFITVTPFSNSCSGVTQTFSITVSPIPSVNAISDQIICSTQPTSLVSFTGSPLAGTNFTWTNTNSTIGLAASGTGNITPFTTINNSNVPTSAVIQVTPISNSCSGLPISFSFTIKPTPVVNTITDQSFCTSLASAPVIFSGSAIAGTIYNWTNSNAAVGLVPLSGTGNISSFTGTNISNIPVTTFITVTPFSNTCSGVAQTFSITINPIPTVNSVTNQSICANSLSSLISFSGSILSGTNYLWTNNNTGIGIAAFTGTNASNLPITAVITVTPVSNSCNGVATNFSITIKPTPTVNFITDQSLCTNLSTLPVTFSGSTIPNTLYQWVNSNSAVGLVPVSGTGNISSFTATNGSNIPISTLITVTPISNACSGVAQTFSIIVNPIPSVNSIADQTICSNLSLGTISFTGSPMAGTNYQWTNNNSLIGLPTAGTGNIGAFTTTNSSNLPISSLITVTPVSNTCSGIAKTFSIIVKPTPTINFVSNQIVCNNLAVGPIIFTGSSIANTIYQWTNNNTNTGLLGLSGTGNISAFTATNVSNIPIYSSISVTPFSNACSGIPQNFSITVNPLPSINSIADQVLCSATSTALVNFTGSPVANTNYQWSNNNSSIGLGLSGIGNILPFSAINTGILQISGLITVTPISNTCAGSSKTFSITVNPIPVINGVSDQTFCNGINTLPITFYSSTANTQFNWTNSNVGIGLSGVSGNGNIGSFNASNITNAPISSIITVTPVSNTCNGLAISFSYIVNPTPTLSSGLTSTAICSGNNFSYTATSVVSGTNYLWSRLSNNAINNNTITSGIGSNINEALTNSTTSSVIAVYAISLTANNCTNSQNVSLTVKPLPVLSSTLTPTGICSGSQFSYTPQSSTTGTTYTWARPTIVPITNVASTGINSIGEILNNPSITAVMVAYNYTLTANGCNNNQQVSVLINPIPTLTPQTTSTCSSIAFSITPSTVPPGTTYTWGAPTISPLASATGGSLQTVGQSSISQTLTNITTASSNALFLVIPSAAGCIGKAFTLTVTINPSPNLSSQTIAPICGGNAFIFNPVNIPGGTIYSWQTPIQIPASSLTGATAQPISQTTVSQILNSNNNLLDTAIYTITPSTALCIGIPFSLTVPVKPLPIVANYKDTICSGTTFTITPNNVPANTTYTWIASSIIPSGSITGNRNQTAPVPIISQTLNNISAVVAQAIYTITPITGNCPGPNFTLTETVWRANPVYAPQLANICSGSTFDVTPGNAPTGTLFTWNTPLLFPAGSALGANGSISPVSRISQTITNLSSGTDTLVYSIIPMVDNCIGTAFSATIKVAPLPQATISSASSICLNQLIDTLSITFTGAAPWSFTYSDNGQTAIKSGITTSPFNLFLPPVSKGTTNRNVIIYNLKDGSCLNTKDSFSFIQKINPLPIGQIISLHGNYLCNGIKDTLFVLSKDSLGYQWKLNGTILPGANTDSIATFSPGTYQTILTNQNNCSDTAISSVTLILAKPPILKFMVDTACIVSKINFTNLTDTSKTGSLQWLWKFGDGNTATVMNPVNTYQISGNYRISFSATQQFCTNYPPTTLDTTINIRFPIPGITMPTVSAYKGQLTPVSARVLPGYKYQWLPSAGIQQPDSSNTNFNLSNTQQYAIKLISPDGCITTDSLLVRVFEENTVNIFVPKSFTPNGDGVNDILYPYIAGIQQFHYFRILNRFGKLIFETKNADTGWNGTINGVPQPMSLYFWIAEGVANDGSIVQKTGQVLLIR